MSNDVQREVGPAQEFIEDVFGALEFEFIKHFGQKWTPEINSLFQEAFGACQRVAATLDTEATEGALVAHANHGRVSRLTNHRAK